MLYTHCKNFSLLVLSFLLGVFCVSSSAHAQSGNVLYPDLKKVLLVMAEVNEEVRSETMDKGFGNVNTLDIVRQQAIDEANARILDKIIKNYGWPTSEMIGLDGVAAAFLVVQHAEHTYQKRMLPAIRSSFERGDVNAGDYAMFVDRILVNDDLPQRYGTQADIRDGMLVLFPIEDRANLEVRRASLGLPSMSEHIEQMEAFYGVKHRGF